MGTLLGPRHANLPCKGICLRWGRSFDASIIIIIIICEIFNISSLKKIKKIKKSLT